MSIRLPIVVVLALFGLVRIEAVADERLDFFESKIRPLLVEHCYECHSHEADDNAGGLYLDSAVALAKGGIGGPAVDSTHPEKSLLLEVVRYESDIQMPPDGKLDDEQIAALEKWIVDGAFDPRESPLVGSSNSDEETATNADDHWAFDLPQRPQVVSEDVGVCEDDPIDRWTAVTAKANEVPIADSVD
ncbi:MAG: c-type cytochrome domain-containing protein, partial [Planctomycetota bacterium]